MTDRMETSGDIVATIRCYRFVLRDGLSGRTGAEILCEMWNWATAPYIARDDRSHRACRRFARLIRRTLDRSGLAYHETESGRLAYGWGGSLARVYL